VTVPKFLPPTGYDDDTKAPPAPRAMPNAEYPWKPSFVSPPGEQAPADQYNYTPHGDDGTYVEDEPGQQAPLDRHQISSPRKLNPDELRGLIAAYRRGPQPLVQDEAGNDASQAEPGPSDQQDRKDASDLKDYRGKVDRGEITPK
jgi:hypothetical protein